MNTQNEDNQETKNKLESGSSSGAATCYAHSEIERAIDQLGLDQIKDRWQGAAWTFDQVWQCVHDYHEETFEDMSFDEIDNAVLGSYFSIYPAPNRQRHYFLGWLKGNSSIA